MAANLLAGWNGTDVHALTALILSESRSRRGLEDDCAVLAVQLPLPGENRPRQVLCRRAGNTLSVKHHRTEEYVALVKEGIFRRVIVVESPDPHIFEQAIFILRQTMPQAAASHPSRWWSRRSASPRATPAPTGLRPGADGLPHGWRRCWAAVSSACWLVLALVTRTAFSMLYPFFLLAWAG